MHIQIHILLLFPNNLEYKVFKIDLFYMWNTPLTTFGFFSLTCNVF